MRLVRHPLVAQDVATWTRHVLSVGRDPGAAVRRLDEIDVLIAAIIKAPDLGARLDGALDDWRVRHGGRGRTLTIVYRPEGDTHFVALVAFAGQDWTTINERRGIGNSPVRGDP